MPTEVEAIRGLISEFFRAAREKDFQKFDEIVRYQGFTKFGDLPPLERKEDEDARSYDVFLYTNITDFNCVIEDLRVQLFGACAVATFYLRYGGILVNDYAFEAKRISARSRATFVLSKISGRWWVVHAHISRLDDSDTPVFGGDPEIG